MNREKSLVNRLCYVAPPAVAAGLMGYAAMSVGRLGYFNQLMGLFGGPFPTVSVSQVLLGGLLLTGCGAVIPRCFQYFLPEREKLSPAALAVMGTGFAILLIPGSYPIGGALGRVFRPSSVTIAHTIHNHNLDVAVFYRSQEGIRIGRVIDSTSGRLTSEIWLETSAVVSAKNGVASKPAIFLK